ncbi:D-glycero-beta-D-manno-heptose 1-phosphate adenylyltransferase [Microbacterium sp. STN6]|nr:D-glycero-beta-D-manno-heptose 1-phosphate adenylyltransferase [Microbacterium sp. STN6]MCX7523136.1 D-glycero-beta-D-manno-heptose 1-phosphate adenylyltransferase [Microbacterium sp. STN6]
MRHLSPRVTVVGDPMLDGWWRGTSNRMAREAPAPIVALDARQYVPGGAANTAMNLAALGARVRFVGLAGDDDAGRRLRDLLASAGVNVDSLVLHPEVTTVTKTRIVVGDQVMVRLDDGQHGAFPADALSALAHEAARAAHGAAAQVICDYGTGTLVGPVREALLSQRERPGFTIVDAHDPVPWAPLRPDLVTPNTEETARLLGCGLERESDRTETVGARAADLLEATGAANAVVTLDRDGTVLLGPGGILHRTWARPAADKQASGAGDTFVAAVTLGRACGLPLTTSVDLAQSAADVVVERFGTSVCSTGDLVGRLAEFADSALEHDELVRQLEQERANGRRIVFTNGCFDVLHRGHTACLNQAKRLGDVLVVAINSDDCVRRLKGSSRPINPASDRASVLAALSCVDYVTVFDTDTPVPLLERVRPDIYAKGGDYSADDLPEAEVVRRHGGQVRILEYLPSHSTTAVVRKIRGDVGREAQVDGEPGPFAEPSRAMGSA